MLTPIPIALLGFSAFERRALESYLRVAGYLGARYTQVLDIAEARFVVADADQPGAIELLRELDRAADAVYIGAQSPPVAAAWMMRPIDPAHVLRELDALHSRRDGSGRGSMPLMAPTAAPEPPTPADALPVGPVPTRRVDDTSSAAPAQAGAAAQAQTTEAKRAAAQTRRQAREAALRPLPLRRALLVDASEVALQALDRQLRHYDLATEWAQHSGKALELLSTQPFGFVFLDVDLGEHSELDGLALCQRIKHHEVPLRGPMPALIVVSARPNATERVRGALAGADAMLGSPPDPAALDRLLQRHGLIRDADTAPCVADERSAPAAPSSTR